MKINRQRRTRLTLLVVSTILIAGFVSSCKKKEEKPQTALFAIPAYPTFTDADATLIAVKVTAPFPANLPIPQIPGLPTGGLDLEMNFGMGLAAFKDNAKADQVLLNGSELKFAGGTHVWLPDFSNLTDPSSVTGVNLNGAITWKVTNPGIEKTLNGMPGSPKISSSTTIQKSGGYTVTHNPVSGATKIMYTIADGKGKEVQKELAGSATSCNFTAAELAAFSTSKTGMIQASAYRVDEETSGGKKIYYIRMSSHVISTAEIQ